VRLNTGSNEGGLSDELARSANHVNLVIARDREFWADLDSGNDALMVNGINVLAENETAMDGVGVSAGAQSRRLSSLFLSDQDKSGDSSYENIDDVTKVSFIAGMDFFIDAFVDGAIEIELTPRGDSGLTQTINVPRKPSDEVRIISVQFRDFVQMHD